MLVLTRKIGESIIIGDNIKITALGTSGNIMKIGVEAPVTISIDREEIRERKRAAQQTIEGNVL